MSNETLARQAAEKCLGKMMVSEDDEAVYQMKYINIIAFTYESTYDVVRECRYALQLLKGCKCRPDATSNVVKCIRCKAIDSADAILEQTE